MTADQLLLKDVKFGIEVGNFLNSNIGKYLLNKADEELNAAREEFDTVDPDNAKAIRDLQFRIYCAKSFGAWLKWAIDDGIAAERTLTGE